MDEVIRCPACNPLDTFVHRVSKVASVAENGWAFVLEMTNCVKIFYLGCEARLKINVSVVVNSLYCRLEFPELAVNHLNRL